jgi:hypothetical protein
MSYEKFSTCCLSGTSKTKPINSMAEMDKRKYICEYIRKNLLNKVDPVFGISLGDPHILNVRVLQQEDDPVPGDPLGLAGDDVDAGGRKAM